MAWKLVGIWNGKQISINISYYRDCNITCPAMPQQWTYLSIFFFRILLLPCVVAMAQEEVPFSWQHLISSSGVTLSAEVSAAISVVLWIVIVHLVAMKVLFFCVEWLLASGRYSWLVGFHGGNVAFVRMLRPLNLLISTLVSRADVGTRTPVIAFSIDVSQLKCHASKI